MPSIEQIETAIWDAIYTVSTISCQRSGCKGEDSIGEDSDVAVGVFYNRGWTVIRGKVCCPKCAEKSKKQ